MIVADGVRQAEATTVVGDQNFVGNVSSTGQFLAANGTAALPSYAYSGEPGTGYYWVGAGIVGYATGGSARILFQSTAINIRSNTGAVYFGTSDDAGIIRDAADILAIHRTTNPSAFRVYNTRTDSANFERLSLLTQTTYSALIQEFGGTGAARPLYIWNNSGGGSVIFRVGAHDAWTVQGPADAGHLIASATAALLFGGSSPIASSRVSIDTNSTSTAVANNANMFSRMAPNPASASQSSFFAGMFIVNPSGANNISGGGAIVAGLYSAADSSNIGSIDAISGGYFESVNRSTGTVTVLAGVRTQVNNRVAGTVSNMRGFSSQMYNNGATAVPVAVHFYAEAPLLTGGVLTRYATFNSGPMTEGANNYHLVMGISAASIPSGTNWAIYSATTYGSLLSGTLNMNTGAAIRLYNGTYDPSNFDRIVIGYETNQAYLYSSAGGSGTVRGLSVGTAGQASLSFFTDNTTRWQIHGATGELLCATDGAFSIGTPTNFRPSDVYASNTMQAANAFIGGSTAYIGWNNRSTMYSSSDGSIMMTNWLGTDFSLLRFGGATASFPALKRNTTWLDARLADDSGYTYLRGRIRFHSTATAETPTATHTVRAYTEDGVEIKLLAVLA